MNRFLKVALASVAAAGVAALGWRLTRRPPASSSAPDPQTNGDFDGRDLTPRQREKLLEELEDQLSA